MAYNQSCGPIVHCTQRANALLDEHVLRSWLGGQDQEGAGRASVPKSAHTGLAPGHLAQPQGPGSRRLPRGSTARLTPLVGAAQVEAQGIIDPLWTQRSRATAHTVWPPHHRRVRDQPQPPRTPDPGGPGARNREGPGPINSAAREGTARDPGKLRLAASGLLLLRTERREAPQVQEFAAAPPRGRGGRDPPSSVRVCSFFLGGGLPEHPLSRRSLVYRGITAGIRIFSAVGGPRAELLNQASAPAAILATSPQPSHLMATLPLFNLLTEVHEHQWFDQGLWLLVSPFG
ncbi:hypothetical protein NDU88_006408 [Pleurodeles waltl]|uniref:Uncharacterized protein n=1 Tax=Pleurodeles waltl TaxID=8319 RepID=A0AAV7MDZ6_PLEWA|nr:hypothetical protein NDU88_006408 [Pleurodeles waltl]